MPGPASSQTVVVAVAHEVAAAGAARPGVGAVAAEDGEAQRHVSAIGVGSTRSSSGPSSRAPRRRNQSDVARGQEPVRARRRRRRAGRGRRSSSIGAHLEGGLVGRRHEHDVAAHHVADRAGQVRVVGAAEQQRVDPGVAHRRQQPLGQHVHLVAAGLAPLDELDEAGAGRAGQLDRSAPAAGDRPLVGARADRADRADHADPAVAGGRHAAPARRARSRRPPAPARSACSSSSAAAAAVLQATTTSFTSCSSTR